MKQRGRGSTFVTEGRVSTFVTEGRVSTFVTEGWVFTFVTEGRVSTFVTEGEGGSIFAHNCVTSFLNVPHFVTLKKLPNTKSEEANKTFFTISNYCMWNTDLVTALSPSPIHSPLKTV